MLLFLGKSSPSFGRGSFRVRQVLFARWMSLSVSSPSGYILTGLEASTTASAVGSVLLSGRSLFTQKTHKM